MKPLKAILLTAIVLVALIVIGSFFLSQLSIERADDGPPGVILAAPPEVKIEKLGEVSRAAAVHRFAELLAAANGSLELGVQFVPGDGQEIFWYAEPGKQGDEILVERRAGPGSTRLETRWHGSIQRRLQWAQSHDSFDAPQLPAGEERNLYH